MDSFLKDISSLTKQKEDEVTWSKIDTLLSRISSELASKEEVDFIFPPLKELLLRSILSDRSKLSGTSLGLLRKMVEVSKGEIQNLNEILPVLLRICGRSNRIVLKRGQDAIVHLCKYVDLTPFSKIFLESSSSTNKNVRLGIFRALEASFSSRDLPKAFERIISKGREDPFNEVRNIAKGMLEGKASEGGDSAHEKRIQKEPFRNPNPPIKASISTNPTNTTNSNAMFGVVRKTTSYQHHNVPVSQSPLKKILKVNSEAKTDSEKITALEEKVKALTNSKANKTKVQKIIETYNTRDLLSAIPKKEKEATDDLTPKKLDRFLSKYRNVYGNVLEEKGKQNEEEGDKQLTQVDNQIEDKQQTHSQVESHVESQVVSQVVSQSEDVLDSYRDKEEVESILESYHLKGVEEKNEQPSVIIESNSSFPSVLVEESLKSIEKEVGNLSIINEEDLPNSSCGKFNFTIVNSEQTEMIQNQGEGIDEEIDEDSDSKEKEDSDSKEKEVVFKQCPQVSDSKQSYNRFSPLLFADKDECVIFDINKEDPKFQTPCNASVKDAAFTSPMDVPVVNNSLSSSFLYSKNEEDQNSDDYTQINSFIYADKKTFSRTPK